MTATRKPKEQAMLNGRLIAAAMNGDEAGMAQALKEGANINGYDVHKVTALHMAARFSPELVGKLLEAGARVNVRDDEGSTPLLWAAQDARSEAVKALLEAGAAIDMGDNDKVTPIHFVAYHYDIPEPTKLLLAAGARLDLTDDLDATPIYTARDSNHPNLAKYLQSVADGKIDRPTPEEAGLDMEKRNVALAALAQEEAAAASSHTPLGATQRARKPARPKQHVPRLDGKTVMIACSPRYDRDFAAGNIGNALQKSGATIVYSDQSPDHIENCPAVSEQIKKHDPAISALIIFNNDLDNNPAKDAALHLIKQYKNEMPVIVCEHFQSVADRQSVEDAGAKFIDATPSASSNPKTRAAAVAQAVQDFDKPGRIPGEPN